MFDRMLRAALLQPQAFEEAKQGGGSMTLQALLVVALAGAFAGLGSGLDADNFGEGFLGAAITDVAGWLLWVVITYYIGTRVFNSHAGFGEVARATGFAYTPGLLLILSFLPILGWIIAVVVTVWRLVAVYIALNVALETNPLFTLLTVLLAILPRIVLGLAIGWLLDIGYI